jgi:hypothetical protein
MSILFYLFHNFFTASPMQKGDFQLPPFEKGKVGKIEHMVQTERTGGLEKLWSATFGN